jgi:hypothetical protein
MLFTKLRRWDDHVMARLRRMYARLLFVVVGMSGAYLVSVLPAFFRWAVPERRLGMAEGGGYTHAHE